MKFNIYHFFINITVVNTYSNCKIFFLSLLENNNASKYIFCILTALPFLKGVYCININLSQKYFQLTLKQYYQQRVDNLQMIELLEQKQYQYELTLKNKTN